MASYAARSAAETLPSWLVSAASYTLLVLLLLPLLLPLLLLLLPLEPELLPSLSPSASPDAEVLPELLLLLPLLDAALLASELPALSLLLDDPEVEAVSDNEPVLPSVPDACASNSTLITPLLTWPDVLEPDEFEFEAPVVVFAAVESAVAFVASDVEALPLAVSALSKAKRAVVVLEELAPEIDICCSWKHLHKLETVFADCLVHISLTA